MRTPTHIDVEPTSTEGRIQESVREWSASLPDSSHLLGAGRYSAENATARIGEHVVFDGRRALSVTLPIPTGADTGKCVTLSLVGGAGPLTVVLAGATVNGAASYSLSADYASKTLVAVGAGKWLAR